MADGAARLSVHLHPLVLINMSDHAVRSKVGPNSSERILGALIGEQEGRRIQLHNSFELVVSGEDTARELDLEFFNQRLAQYLEVYPRYEFLGWYSTGSTPHENDKVLHKKIQEVTGNENPFALLLDTEAMERDRSNQSEELPVKVYDSVTHISEGASVIQWTEVPYMIDTLEAERISVNHVAKAATTTSSGHTSDFTQHTGSLGNSVVMLSKRVKDLLEYMKDVKAGNAPKNHEVLRQTLSICRALKASHPEALQKEFCDEFNDANLVVLMSSLTKTCAHTSDLLDKFQLAHDKKHRQRHHYPFG
jgi:COP9 signalosome complex subunit 6